jgi:hypothetical protein
LFFLVVFCFFYLVFCFLFFCFFGFVFWFVVFFLVFCFVFSFVFSLGCIWFCLVRVCLLLFPCPFPLCWEQHLPAPPWDWLRMTFATSADTLRGNQSVPWATGTPVGWRKILIGNASLAGFLATLVNALGNFGNLGYARPNATAKKQIKTQVKHHFLEKNRVKCRKAQFLDPARRVNAGQPSAFLFPGAAACGQQVALQLNPAPRVDMRPTPPLISTGRVVVDVWIGSGTGLRGGVQSECVLFVCVNTLSVVSTASMVRLLGARSEGKRLTASHVGAAVDWTFRCQDVSSVSCLMCRCCT